MRLICGFLTVISLLMCFPSAANAGGKRSGDKLRVAFVGDPQVDDSLQLGYTRASVYKELRQRDDIDLVIVLGDLVNNTMSLLEPTRESLDSLPCKWYVLPGNHDFDVYKGKKAVIEDSGRSRDLVTWNKVFGGPDVCAVHSGVRFVMMKDIIYNGAEYRGGFSPAQEQWLDSLMRADDGERLTVIATHIPYSHIKKEYRSRTDSILAKYPHRLLFVSGHTHTVRRASLELGPGREVPELIAGASCGTWWRGVRDSDGIPYALQNCGAPRGYFIADFSHEGYELRYKCIGREAGNLASASVVDCGSDSLRLVVNVFGGAVDASVLVKAKGLNSGRWTSLGMIRETAPEVRAVVNAQKKMSRQEQKEKKTEILPLRNYRSSHVWSVHLPEGKVDGKVKIRYSDPHMKFTVKVPCVTSD